MSTKLTWRIATCNAIWRHTSNFFTLQALCNCELDQIVSDVGSIGKTPSFTLQRELQLLRKYGFIEFMSDLEPKLHYLRGVYKIINPDFYPPPDRTSIGEYMVSHVLNQLNIMYETEKSFADMRGINITRDSNVYTVTVTGYLRFDFYFIHHGVAFAIEYDGEQHFRPVKIFGGEENYKQTVIRDKRKNRYARCNNIKLLRVSQESNLYDSITHFISVNVQHCCRALPF